MLIDDDIKLQINQVVDLARNNPISSVDLAGAQASIGDALLAWKQRLNDFTMRIQVGFMVTYTHDYQPAGLCHHINMSRFGGVPDLEDMIALCDAFGMPNITENKKIVGAWIENYTN